MTENTEATARGRERANEPSISNRGRRTTTSRSTRGRRTMTKTRRCWSRLKMAGEADVGFAGLLPGGSAPVSKFGDNREEDGRRPEAADAPPARNVPTPGT